MTAFVSHKIFCLYKLQFGAQTRDSARVLDFYGKQVVQMGQHQATQALMQLRREGLARRLPRRGWEITDTGWEMLKKLELIEQVNVQALKDSLKKDTSR